MDADAAGKNNSLADRRCDCGCETPVATEPIGMLEFLAGRFELAGVSEAVATVYAHDIRHVLSKVRSSRHASELTDAELADPAYMRAYVESCFETTQMFADRAARLQLQLNGFMRPAPPAHLPKAGE